MEWVIPFTARDSNHRLKLWHDFQQPIKEHIVMTTLKEAREKGKLEEFIKEHEKDPKGKKELMDKTIKNLSEGKCSPTVGTSKK